MLMTQEELTQLNIGESLDHIANLDFRGYGVCRILYEASRAAMGEPLSMHAAKQLLKSVHEGDIVYILTGFVLPPHGEAEMDGIISSMILARALVIAFDATPVLICQDENMAAVEKLANLVGLHLYETIEEAHTYPISMAAIPFTKHRRKADAMAERLIQLGMPSLVISIEAPGANELGVYHNATGIDVTTMEAKSDRLFNRLKELGVVTMAIGDLGNEIGMGTIRQQLFQYVPYCNSVGGIAADSEADVLITATVSDWGCYSMIAALSYLKQDKEIFPTEELVREVIVTASRNGMIDMTGWLIPSVDGMGLRIQTSIVALMRECIISPLKLKKTCITWFEKVDELGYYEK